MKLALAYLDTIPIPQFYDYLKLVQFRKRNFSPNNGMTILLETNIQFDVVM